MLELRKCDVFILFFGNPLPCIMIRTLRLICTLVCLWFLLSGMFKPMLLILGVISVTIVVFFAYRMKVLEHQGQPIYFRFLAILNYWVWLARQIWLSNVDVTKRVWRKSLDIQPSIKPVKATPNTELGRVVYANSITLTPGTTTISFTPDDDVLVHALHVDSMADLEAGEMAARVSGVEPHFTLERRTR